MTEHLRLPPRLRRGDTIGLFCPAGPVQDVGRLQAGIRLIKDQGFEIKLCGAHGPSDGYLADSDEQRAASLHGLWADEEVRALLAIRGGYGCLRLLDRLDWDLLSRRPKFLIGFSDVTVLLNTLVDRAGIVTVHGPMVTTLSRYDEDVMCSLFRLLTGHFEEHIRSKKVEVLRGGVGRGRLIGGNLTTLAHLLGTPWECSWEGKILVIEDTGEPLYRIDRMLTQLALAGRFEQLAGLLIGEFDVGSDSITNLRLQEAVWSRVLELAPAGYPIWGCFPVGHGKRNLALPLGMEMIMDSGSGSLHLLADSVVFI
ncbi:MAG: LD-carboxypeptidase [Desulfobulbus sp.]|nr:LD-carboxypeptidase [Desulfobulbus sp.]